MQILDNSAREWGEASLDALPLGTIDIIDYAPQYKEEFKRLNLEWIEYYFSVEPIDNVLLSDPEKYFITPGGAIFFAKCLECDQIVGTCALLKHQERGAELAKMGVTRLYRSVGIGHKLVEAALEKVRSLGEKQIWLETNSKLIPAMHLYKKFGFRTQPWPNGRSSDRYQRANVYMILEL